MILIGYSYLHIVGYFDNSGWTRNRFEFSTFHERYQRREGANQTHLIFTCYAESKSYYLQELLSNRKGKLKNEWESAE